MLNHFQNKSSWADHLKFYSCQSSMIHMINQIMTNNPIDVFKPNIVMCYSPTLNYWTWNLISLNDFLQNMILYWCFQILDLLLMVEYRDNYSKPTWGLARLRFTYPWFKTYHFAHLRYFPLGICCPPLHLPLEKHIFREKQT